MKLTFLRTDSGSGRLLLIAAGWSSSPQFYSRISMPGWDTAVVTQDATDENVAEIVAAANAYKTIYLYAWSLGVALSESLFAAGLHPTAAFAVGGTSIPSSDTEGIPAAIYNATCENLDRRNLMKFRCRMCGGVSAFLALAESLSSEEKADDIAVLQQELRLAASRDVVESLPWTVAYLPLKDAIFPPDAQRRHWKRRGVDVKELDAPHYVDLQSVIDATVVNLPRAGKRFERSHESYSRHAQAQSAIARRLASMIASDFKGDEVTRMLEVGCGSGELSRALGEMICIEQATYVDLYQCRPFGVAKEERCVVADAEIYVEELAADTFDLICSSSAMQWFSDTRRFLQNCRRLLAPGGVVALSTFAKGNLAELDAVRDSSIGYLTEQQLAEMSSEIFPNVEVKSEKIRLHFPSPADAMRHLKFTGVTASAAKSMSPKQLRRFLDSFPTDKDGGCTLTFLPVYILAHKD